MTDISRFVGYTREYYIGNPDLVSILIFGRASPINEIIRLSRPQVNAYKGQIKRYAVSQWKKAKALAGLENDYMNLPAQFLVIPIAPCEPLPDSDSTMFVAKTVLDAAREADVIPDDSPEYITETRLVAPILDRNQSHSCAFAIERIGA